jgi:hypothetical protein
MEVRLLIVVSSAADYLPNGSQLGIFPLPLRPQPCSRCSRLPMRSSKPILQFAADGTFASLTFGG